MHSSSRCVPPSQKPQVDGTTILALALDTTGSTVVPVGEGLEPLDDYYLWCDHRALAAEAARITEVAHDTGLPAIRACGGVYSSEWGFAKLLHWLRHNPDRRSEFVTALEHCDMVASVLCGITDPALVPRSICAMGHKWLWSGADGGLPPEDFLVKVDPLFKGVRAQLNGRYEKSDRIAGHLTLKWAERLGLAPGIPIPVGAFDAHWDAIGAGMRRGRRCGERDRHGDVRDGDRTGDERNPGPLRHCPWFDTPGPGRHRSRTLCDGIPARVHRAPFETPPFPSCPRDSIPIAPVRRACSASTGTTAIAPSS